MDYQNNIQNNGQHYYQPNKNNNRKSVLTIVLAICCILLLICNVFFIVFNIARSFGSSDSVSNSKIKQLEKIIDDYYIGDISKDDMREGVYKGIVESLNDPYSTYYTKEEFDEYMLNQQGSYSGIGAALLKDEESGYVIISKVYDGSPAQKEGLLDGDLIVSADGKNAVDMDVSDFAAVIRGKKGTEVLIEFIRDGKQQSVSITRDDIERQTVTYMMLDDNIGYIEISEFVENTADEFKKAVDELEEMGMEAVVYDLRSNPGGLVDAVTDILDYILPEGLLVYMEDKKGERTEYKSDNKHSVDLPTVVLINEGSASASEIFAGAVRDFEYGTLIGKNTYGKGIVQTILKLSDGSAIKVTFASYYTPNGENIHGKGIAPDIDLDYEYDNSEKSDEYDYTKDNQVLKAIEVLKKGIRKEK